MVLAATQPKNTGSLRTRGQITTQLIKTSPNGPDEGGRRFFAIAICKSKDKDALRRELDASGIPTVVRPLHNERIHQEFGDFRGTIQPVPKW